MSLTLMYITNNPEVAIIAQNAGVDRIWVDMEFMGKDERQAGLDTVKSHHTISDVKAIRSVLTTSELLVRINPYHTASGEYIGSKTEIDQVIEAGADVIMLPYFKCVKEVKDFVDCVGGRVKTMILVETREAVECLDEILRIKGIDEAHIGLNDLHISYRLDFMFELLANGVVADVCKKFKEAGLKYGFGGVARVGYGLLPAEFIITEHYALGSTAAILSRDFCNANKIENVREIEDIFINGIKGIRNRELASQNFSIEELRANHEIVVKKTVQIAEMLRKKRVSGE